MSNANRNLKEAFRKEFTARGLEGSLFEQLVERLAELAPIAIESDLVHRLHEACCHPDYEYETTTAAYKGGYEKPPENGEGWEENVDKDGGLTRDEPVEYQHWRRLKHYALTDEVKFWDLPQITLKKMSLSAFLTLLRSRIDENRLVGGCKSEGPHSKYRYVHRYGEIFNSTDTEFYAYSWDIEGGIDKEADWPFKLRDFSQKGLHNSKPYLLLALSEHPFRLLIDCENPEDSIWISVLRANNTYGPWRQAASEIASLPINAQTLLEELDKL